MPRPARSRLSPWIESLIQSHGSEEGSSSSGGRLKADVIGVDQMSQSQAQSSEGPSGLLHLSDGVAQIPAILTTLAWEHLQEQEDRECFNSLLNTTIYIRDYKLQFHMVMELTKCRFFILVGELATTAAGPVKDKPPCCTTLPSVKLKTYKTWKKALLSQDEEDSQKSQSGFDLSELLGEWHHDCLQTVLEDMGERLMTARSRPESQQPSTSTCIPPLTHPDTFTSTSWDLERVQYKGAGSFSIPIKCLLIPEEDAQLGPSINAGSRTPNSETSQPSVDNSDWQIPKSAVAVTEHHTSKNSPFPAEDSMLHDVAARIHSGTSPLSNPWDIFPPPCDTSSSSDASLEAPPNQSLGISTPVESTREDHVILACTSLPFQSSNESQHSKGELSYFPPYQKMPPSTSLPVTTCSPVPVSPLVQFTRSSNLSNAAVEQSTHTTQNIPTSDQGREILKNSESKGRKAKRKRDQEPTAEAQITLVEEEAQISGSPPSWLFDSQTNSGLETGSSHQHAQTLVTEKRKTTTVHIDGRPFSYSYRVTGQNLQDFSRFKVTQSLLHWAVKYLVVPKQTEKTQKHTSEVAHL